MKVLLDVDGVLADLVGALAEASGGLFRPEDVTSYNFSDCLSKTALRGIEREMIRPGFVEDIPECRGARALFTALICAGHRPVFVTKPYAKSPTWAYERTRWLESVFGGNLEIVHTASKELISGDVLVEDSVENIRAWLKEHPKAWAFLVDRPWNQGIHPGRISRVDLKDIARLIGHGVPS